MPECSFRIEDTFFIKNLGRWALRGRAYADVRVGDILTSSTHSGKIWRVEEIEAYGKKTNLISRMMTGILIASTADEICDGDTPQGKLLCTVIAHAKPHRLRSTLRLGEF